MLIELVFGLKVSLKVSFMTLGRLQKNRIVSYCVGASLETRYRCTLALLVMIFTVWESGQVLVESLDCRVGGSIYICEVGHLWA